MEDLGDGLVLRFAGPDDADRLAAFNARIHADPPQTWDEGTAAWTRDLIGGAHPTCRAHDALFVEDTATGAIVSSVCGIPQTWSYGGVPFGVTKPELVGTDPAFRRRGLVRAQFATLHRRSAARGDLIQAITGIPGYYRRFGYEPALEIGGGRVVFSHQVPPLPGDGEPYRVRPATVADAPYLARASATADRRRSLVWCPRDEAIWRYEIGGREAGNRERADFWIVATPEGSAVGFCAVKPGLYSGYVWASAYEVNPGVSWLAVTPVLLRAVRVLGEARVAEGDPPLTGVAFRFWGGSDHPVYRVLPDQRPAELPPPDTFAPFAWSLRVPDIPGFVRHVTPILERRLAASILVGHTGVLRLNCYEFGLRLDLDGGRVTAEPWTPRSGDPGDAAFPGQTVLQLLFGYRSVAELEHAHGDCWVAGRSSRLVLDTLFPRGPSSVWSVG